MHDAASTVLSETPSSLDLLARLDSSSPLLVLFISCVIAIGLRYPAREISFKNK